MFAVCQGFCLNPWMIFCPGFFFSPNSFVRFVFIGVNRRWFAIKRIFLFQSRTPKTKPNHHPPYPSFDQLFLAVNWMMHLSEFSSFPTFFIHISVASKKHSSSWLGKSKTKKKARGATFEKNSMDLQPYFYLVCPAWRVLNHDRHNHSPVFFIVCAFYLLLHHLFHRMCICIFYYPFFFVCLW